MELSGTDNSSKKETFSEIKFPFCGSRFGFLKDESQRCKNMKRTLRRRLNNGNEKHLLVWF